jgi:dihydrodipicolinate synthase/N-acetylneuraminate lyase
VVAPLFTPERPDGRIDFDGLEAQADYLCGKEGVAALMVRSGPGRMWSFTLEEVRDAIGCVLAVARDRKPVLANCAGIWDGDPTNLPRPEVYRRQSAELSLWAMQNGAAAVLQPAPTPIQLHNDFPPQDVALRFFEDLSRTTGVPIVIYNQTETHASCALSVPTLIRLSRTRGVIGVICNTTDMAVLGDLVRCCEPGFVVGIANDTVASSAFLAGVSTSAGPLATLFPEILHTSWHGLHENDTLSVWRTQTDLLAAHEHLAPWKIWDIGCFVMRRLGVDMEPRSRNAQRQPLPEEAERVARHLDRIRVAYL